MDKISIDADGVKIKAWGETTGDVRLKINDGEHLYLSPATAHAFGLGLIAIATKPDPEA